MRWGLLPRWVGNKKKLELSITVKCLFAGCRCEESYTYSQRQNREHNDFEYVQPGVDKTATVRHTMRWLLRVAVHTISAPALLHFL